MSTGKSQARVHANKRVTQTSARADFQPLGSFVSSASRVQLLAALKRLKPQLNTRLRELKRSPYTHHYQLEVDSTNLHQQHEIDLWLGIKGALTSAFPEHKPGAVRRLEP